MVFSYEDEGQTPFRYVPANQYGPSVGKLGKGSLINFNYAFFKHDPNPLIIITDIFQGHIRGVNLHYLTFPFIKRILSGHCDNMMFSYFLIKSDNYIVNAFRTYKRLGIRRVRRLDCKFLLNVLSGVRTFNPAEVQAMREHVRQQLNRQANKRANAMTGMLGTQPGFEQPFTQPPEGEFSRI